MNRKIQLVFGSAILILCAVGSVSYHSVVLSGESDRWVRHTHEVLENLQSLVSDVASIESSARGFVLTGDQSFLESYYAATVSAERDEAVVRNLTVDNPQQQRELPAVETLIARQIQLGNTVIGLRRAKGFENAAGLVKSGQGQSVMNAFRESVREMQAEELQLLALRNAEAKARPRSQAELRRCWSRRWVSVGRNSVQYHNCTPAHL